MIKDRAKVAGKIIGVPIRLTIGQCGLSSDNVRYADQDETLHLYVVKVAHLWSSV